MKASVMITMLAAAASAAVLPCTSSHPENGGQFVSPGLVHRKGLAKPPGYHPPGGYGPPPPPPASSSPGYNSGSGPSSAYNSGSGPSSAYNPAQTTPAAYTSTQASPTGYNSAQPSPSGYSPPHQPLNTSTIRGINIGNWLLLERWMDSTNLFSGDFGGAQDQWTFDSIPGAQQKIEEHWSTWFTQKDVQKLASWGFNALRIPVGYWAFMGPDGTPYIRGAAKHLDNAIGWARQAGMKVLIDCHGSPGSQNGHDHSGHSGEIKWQQDGNLQKSTQALVNMAKRYGTAAYADVVMGIEIVNEPSADAPNDFETSKQWAAQAYDAMKAVVQNKQLQIVTHDSFRGPTQFIDVNSKIAQGGKTGARTFAVDQHDYQLYTDGDNALNQDQHVANACGWGKDLSTTKAQMPVYVGEWSALTNVCVADDGSATWAGTSCDSGCQCTSADPAQWSDAVKKQVRRYVEAQLDTYEQHANGFFVWSYKAPGAWGPENLVANGVWPQPMDQRHNPGQCNGQGNY